MAGVEELALVAEIRVNAETTELVGGDIDARCIVLTVGLDTRIGRLAPLAIVPLSARAPTHVRVHVLRAKQVTKVSPMAVNR